MTAPDQSAPSAPDVVERAPEDGCTCQGCGTKYRVDVLLPDDLWSRISLGHNLLCGECIFQRIGMLGEFAAYELNEPGDLAKAEATAEREKEYRIRLAKLGLEEQHRAEKAEAERDEAREKLSKIRESLVHVGAQVSTDIMEWQWLKNENGYLEAINHRLVMNLAYEIAKHTQITKAIQVLRVEHRAEIDLLTKGQSQ